MKTQHYTESQLSYLNSQGWLVSSALGLKSSPSRLRGSWLGRICKQGAKQEHGKAEHRGTPPVLAQHS